MMGPSLGDPRHQPVIFAVLSVLSVVSLEIVRTHRVNGMDFALLSVGFALLWALRE